MSIRTSLGKFQSIRLTYYVLMGIVSWLPGLHSFGMKKRIAGDRRSARYYYSVWLRHLSEAYKHGFSGSPKVVCEFGPGDSIGSGLTALLAGASTYYAVDVVPYTPDKMRMDLEIFEELVALFENREDIPDETEFPLILPRLQSYRFPSEILTVDYLSYALSAERLAEIRNAIQHIGKQQEGNKVQISFLSWNDTRSIARGSVDVVHSQAVMEHVEDLSASYSMMYDWLRDGGLVSHSIDFKCHGTSVFWNGHWGYSDFLWKLMRGNKSFFLNRAPHSVHINKLEQAGFDVVRDISNKADAGIDRKELAAAFADLTDEDLRTETCFVQGIKKCATINQS